MTVLALMEHVKQQSLKRGYDEEFMSTKHAYAGDFGSPINVDPEYYSAPKRKCISLNQEGFGIPMEVFCVPRLSSVQRRSLMSRFNGELDKIRDFQKKHASQLNKMVVDRAARESWAAAVSKKSGIVGHNGSKVRRGPKGKFESAKVHKPITSSAIEGISVLSALRQCESLLKKIMTLKLAILYFNNPVDVVLWNIPDYFDIIKEPMDLGTVLSKIRTRQYVSPYAFAEDVRLTFKNAMKYNPAGNLVYIAADTLSRMFESKWKPLEKKFAASNIFDSGYGVDRRPVSQLTSVMPPSVDPAAVSTVQMKPKMNLEETKKLEEQLDSYQLELPSNIVSFLEFCTGSAQDGEGYLVIEMDSFSDDQKFELRKLMDEFLLAKKKNQSEEIEALNVSGVSNPSVQTQGGPDPVEEDVDICGMEPLSISRPSPTLKDRDQQDRGDESSSSDSDSESDGGSASDSPNGNGGPKINVKENILSDKSDGVSSVEVNRLQEHETQSKPSALEGENSKPERQVSPEKLYRAAVVRSRFAETILKAKEKMHTQGDNVVDPETIRQDREFLEKMQREDEARQLAEAKAAEEARIQAELQAKRQREMEREAARQALQKMEKTVEIDDYHTLKDLEMLRTAKADHIVSSGDDETVPDIVLPGMPGFQPGSNNTLEQLGLYMRADFEEDEEEPRLSPSQADPVVSSGNDKAAPDLAPEGMPAFQPGSNNALEQLGLYVRSDMEEDEEDPKSSPAQADSVVSSGNDKPAPDLAQDDVPGFQPGSNNALEQLGLYMRSDMEEDVEDPKSSPAQADPVVRSGDNETAPDHLVLEGMPGSKNALEQLGLYMRADMEEEEEEPRSSPAQVDPVVSSGGDEMATDPVLEGMPGFQPGSSNALEQLGLYMPADMEEDEEESRPPAQADHVVSSAKAETAPDLVHEGMAGFQPGSKNNALELLGLYRRADSEEDEEEPRSPTTDGAKGDE